MREEANQGLTLAMQPYDEEFSAVEARKELLDAIVKADDDVAIDVISNLNEVEMSKAKTDDDSNVKEGNVAILSRLDTAQYISARAEEKKLPLPPLTDIIASSLDGKVRGRRSKRIQEKEKPYDR